MNAQPALAAPAPVDPAAVAQGAAIFNDPTVGCTACHSGPQLSTHALVDVGTGGTFKVPSLIAVGYRAPYLHDGCAATLQDRFGPTCGGGNSHGQTQQLDHRASRRPGSLPPEPVAGERVVTGPTARATRHLGICDARRPLELRDLTPLSFAITLISARPTRKRSSS